jgi:hypothetical protein
MISPSADGGWFKSFCARYVISADPNEADEIIEEARQLYPNVNEFRLFLREMYSAEMAKEKPNERLLSLIMREIEPD